MSEFKPVNSEDRLLYELMPILIGIGPNGDILCYGSCFIASPHMAITAKHVVEELLKQDSAIALGNPCKYEYWVVQIIWNGNQHSYVVWTIDTVATSPHSDIAIVWLRGLDQNAAQYRQWKTLRTTFDPPPVGATIRAFGLHNVRFDGSHVNAEGKFEHIEVNFDLSVSTGIVRQHYWGWRDMGMYNFPCFEVNARFELGMSGVINEHSEVCGIVCGSLPAASEDEEHVSYVTMLWPMMVIPVRAGLISGELESARYYLRDLSARGVFTPYGWERVHIKDDIEAGGALTISYLNLK